MPLSPSALPPKGKARHYVANDFLNLIALPINCGTVKGQNTLSFPLGRRPKEMMLRWCFPSFPYAHSPTGRQASHPFPLLFPDSFSHRISQKIDRKAKECDACTGSDHHQRVGSEIGPRIRNHDAPIRRRRRDAQSQVRQRRSREQRSPDAKCQ